MMPTPHDPDQQTMWLLPLDATAGPLGVTLRISLHRSPRRRCTYCGLRRVCFFVGLGEALSSPPLCAKCAGIR